MAGNLATSGVYISTVVLGNIYIYIYINFFFFFIYIYYFIILLFNIYIYYLLLYIIYVTFYYPLYIGSTPTILYFDLYLNTAFARNVRLYFLYRQYTNLFIFRFVSEHCLRSTLYVYFIYTLRLSNFRNFLSYSEAEFDLGPVDRCQGSTAIARLNINLVSYMGRNSSHFPGIAPESTGACSFQRIRTRHVEHSFRLTHCG